jgi:hypothetical protein
MRLLNFIYWSHHAEYASNYPVWDAVTRLKGQVHTGFIPWAGVNGKVSEHKVRLYRVIPFWANSFAPIFLGKFESSNGKVRLSGSYSMHFAVKLFMTLWFAATLSAFIIGIGGLAIGNTTLRENRGLLLIPCGLFVFGLLLTKSGQWFSRGDIGYISRVIQSALE